jgi:hypothetical protein
MPPATVQAFEIRSHSRNQQFAIASPRLEEQRVTQPRSKIRDVNFNAKTQGHRDARKRGKKQNPVFIPGIPRDPASLPLCVKNVFPHFCREHVPMLKTGGDQRQPTFK